MQRSINAIGGKARRWVLFLLMLPTLVAALPASGIDDSGYVYYFGRFGEWAVICSVDEPTVRHRCRLVAPPPQLFDPRSEIEVQRTADGGHRVMARRLRSTARDAPVYLRIDALPPHRAHQVGPGEAWWEGTEATAIIDELRSGTFLGLRSFVDTIARPRDEYYFLDRFEEALGEYEMRSGHRPPVTVK